MTILAFGSSCRESSITPAYGGSFDFLGRSSACCAFLECAYFIRILLTPTPTHSFLCTLQSLQIAGPHHHVSISSPNFICTIAPLLRQINTSADFCTLLQNAVPYS